MSSFKKLNRGFDFLIQYSCIYEYDIAEKTVTDAVNYFGSSIKVLMIGCNDKGTSVLLKVLSYLSFRDVKKFQIKDDIPDIIHVYKSENNFNKEVETIKAGVHKIIEDWVPSKMIVKSELGGHIFDDAKRDPYFDETEKTQFGIGYRRVSFIYNSKGKITGSKLIPFTKYDMSWCSDIYGYETFEDVVRNVSPLQFQEIRYLKAIYNNRPRTYIAPKIDLSEWQVDVISKLNDHIPLDGHGREYHWYFDLSGKLGKSIFCRYLKSTRDDTIYLGCDAKRGDLSHLASKELNNSEKIRNVIIDLPREKVDPRLAIQYHLPFNIKSNDKNDGGLYEFMEQCANGMLTSTKFDSGNPYMAGCLKIFVFSNSLPDIMVTSVDRWRISIIDDQKDFLCKDYTFTTQRRDLNTREIIQEYFHIPGFREYLSSRGDDVSKIEAAVNFKPKSV